MNTSIDPSGSIVSPRFASSPNRRSQTPVSKSKTRLLVINFQNLRSERERELQDSESDIVPTSQTLLSPSIAEREALPDSYQFAARRDPPNSSHGGMVIIAGLNLEASEIDLHNNEETVELQGFKETHNCWYLIQTIIHTLGSKLFFYFIIRKLLLFSIFA